MKITLTIDIELPERLANIDPVDFEGFKVKVKETKPEAKKEPEPVKITKEIPLPENHIPVPADATVESMIKIKPGVKPLPGKICVICGNRFMPKSSERTCSEPCRKAHHKNMKKVYNQRYGAKKKASNEPKKMPVTLHGPMTKPAGVTGIIDTSKQPEHIKPDPGNHKTVVLKSGHRLCGHCKEPFKITKFEQHFCSDSCEVLHRKNHKEPAMV